MAIINIQKEEFQMEWTNKNMRPSHVKRINKKITETKGEKKHESILSKIFLQRTILVTGYYTSCLLKNSFVSTTPSVHQQKIMTSNYYCMRK